MKGHPEKGSYEVKVGLAEMLKGGVIFEVATPEQAKIAQEAGAVAVMAFEKCLVDSSCSRMSAPELIQKIQEAVSIPVMAKCRTGHFVEAEILEALFVDFIDESETLNAADEENFIDKHAFQIPFACGAAHLGEALQRIGEGAALIRTKDLNTFSATVKQMRRLMREIRQLTVLDPSELPQEAVRMGAPLHLVKKVAQTGKLPVPLFASGCIATPADAALMVQLGAETLFVGSMLFLSEDPLNRAQSIVGAAAFPDDPELLAKLSMGLLEDIQGEEKPCTLIEQQTLRA